MSPLDKQKVDLQNVSLVEVGPRCCLNPIKIFAGSFGGPVLYENPAYVSPNLVRCLPSEGALSRCNAYASVL